MLRSSVFLPTPTSLYLTVGNWEIQPALGASGLLLSSRKKQLFLPSDKTASVTAQGWPEPSPYSLTNILPAQRHVSEQEALKITTLAAIQELLWSFQNNNNNNTAPTFWLLARQTPLMRFPNAIRIGKLWWGGARKQKS